VCGWVVGAWGGRGNHLFVRKSRCDWSHGFDTLRTKENEARTHAHKHTHARTHARTYTYIHLYMHMCVCARESVVGVCGIVCVRERESARTRTRALQTQCVVYLWCVICVSVYIHIMYRYVCMCVYTSQTTWIPKIKRLGKCSCR